MWLRRGRPSAASPGHRGLSSLGLSVQPGLLCREFCAEKQPRVCLLRFSTGDEPTGQRRRGCQADGDVGTVTVPRQHVAEFLLAVSAQASDCKAEHPRATRCQDGSLVTQWGLAGLAGW